MAQVQIDTRVLMVIDVPDGMLIKDSDRWSPLFKAMLEDVVRQRIRRDPTQVSSGWVKVIQHEVSKCVS